MDIERKIALLRMFYTAALADSVVRLGNAGALGSATAAKKDDQIKPGKIRAQQLWVEGPAAVSEVLIEIFGCANWRIERDGDSFTATATSCMLCGMARKIGAGSPCNIHCPDPMEGMVKGLSPDADYRVESTHCRGKSCRVVVTERRR